MDEGHNMKNNDLKKNISNRSNMLALGDYQCGEYVKFVSTPQAAGQGIIWSIQFKGLQLSAVIGTSPPPHLGTEMGDEHATCV
jgi:hypothetical protein